MTDLTSIAPARRTDLVLSTTGDDGQCIVKDPVSGKFFNLGPEEAFLLNCLDGRHTTVDIRDNFEREFGEPLSEEEVDDFVELARQQKFLVVSDDDSSSATSTSREQHHDDPFYRAVRDWPLPGEPESESTDQPDGARNSLLYWRTTLFDPNSLFNWLEPRIRFVWTPTFLVLSLAWVAAAGWVVWTDRQALVTQLPQALQWQALVLGWAALITATMLHEFAHGLTCKHFGGQVREIGFLMMYFMPCFFCNVSDSWLFREKSKRLWVTLAGGYCDLLMWATAVFIWRVTTPESLVNNLAWIILSVCGMRIFFNFNPLLKLDGYYLLSDWLGINNLRQRAWESWLAHVRWALWGAARPEPQPRGRFLLAFGATSWMYSLMFLGLMYVGVREIADLKRGLVGVAWMIFLGVVITKSQFLGFSGGEFKKMFQERSRRVATWCLLILGLVLALTCIEVEDRVSGEFRVRGSRRADVRAPVAGFLRDVQHEEGDKVSPGAVLARLEVPDLTSRISQKHAEIHEAESRLKLLEIGPRHEQVTEQRAQVARLEAWRDRGRLDLGKLRQAFQEEIVQLDESITRSQSELELATTQYRRAYELRSRSALSIAELRELESKVKIASSGLKQAWAQKRARLAEGTITTEAELANRERSLAEAKAALSLLLAGSRPEEIEAERSRLTRLKEEAAYLDVLRSREPISSPLSGVVVTPRLHERIGQFLREGELICEVEEVAELRLEITISEQDSSRVRRDQEILLKARALPFQTFRAHVERIAPRAAPSSLALAQAAAPSDPQSAPNAAVKPSGSPVVTVHCHLEDPESLLRPGMSGFARVYCGRKPIGQILAIMTLRVIRTEFWW